MVIIHMYRFVCVCMHVCGVGGGWLSVIVKNKGESNKPTLRGLAQAFQVLYSRVGLTHKH
jgi:hypothetical protein